MKYFLVKVFIDSCGDYGCEAVHQNKIVGAENEDQAKDLVADGKELSIHIEHVKELNLPSLEEREEAFIYA